MLNLLTELGGPAPVKLLAQALGETPNYIYSLFAREMRHGVVTRKKIAKRWFYQIKVTK